MSTRPFLDHLRALEQLNGEPSVTYPDSLSYPVVERVYEESLGTAMAAFGSADPDATNFNGCKLVYCQIYGMDRHKRKVYRRYEKVPGYSKITPFIDDETQTAGTITRQLVVKPSFPLTQTAGSLVSYTPSNDYCGYLTTQTLTDYASAGRTEQTLAEYPFPHRIYGVTVALAVALDGQARRIMQWDEIAGFNALTSIQQIVSYGTRADLVSAAPSIEYAPIFKNLSYDGALYNVAKSQVLCDAITIAAQGTGPTNPTWGYFVEAAVSFPATTPSATQYDALKNAYRVVGLHLEPWKYNLWRMTVKKVYLR